MVVLRTLIITGLLAVVVEALTLEGCPTNYTDGFTESLVEAVCGFDAWSEAATVFRNETRFYHNASSSITDGELLGSITMHS